MDTQESLQIRDRRVEPVDDYIGDLVAAVGDLIRQVLLRMALRGRFREDRPHSQEAVSKRIEIADHLSQLSPCSGQLLRTLTPHRQGDSQQYFAEGGLSSYDREPWKGAFLRQSLRLSISALVVLAVLFVLALPAATEAAPRRTPTFTGSLWSLFTAIWPKAGCIIDPNGVNGSDCIGCGMDPNGVKKVDSVMKAGGGYDPNGTPTSDAGAGYDPDGAQAETEAGSQFDPNG